ncbi:hypothetical protein JCM8795_05720 [Hydrogenobaculum acidophilum]
MKIASGELPIELGLEKIFYVFKDTTYLRYFLLEVYRNVNIDLER